MSCVYLLRRPGQNQLRHIRLRLGFQSVHVLPNKSLWRLIETLTSVCACESNVDHYGQAIHHWAHGGRALLGTQHWIKTSFQSPKKQFVLLLYSHNIASQNSKHKEIYQIFLRVVFVLIREQWGNHLITILTIIPQGPRNNHLWTNIFPVHVQKFALQIVR